MRHIHEHEIIIPPLVHIQKCIYSQLKPFPTCLIMIIIKLKPWRAFMILIEIWPTLHFWYSQDLRLLEKTILTLNQPKMNFKEIFFMEFRKITYLQFKWLNWDYFNLRRVLPIRMSAGDWMIMTWTLFI